MNDYPVSQSNIVQALGGAPTWSPDHPEIIRLLTEATILDCEALPWGSNYVFLARLDGGSAGDSLAVYKPQAGEAPLYDFPGGTLYLRELAAYLVSEELGWHIVPPTVIREGPHGVGTMQLFIVAEPESNYTTWHDQRTDDLKRIALFDCLTNNADRKGGHCILDRQGRLWGIDHGITFNWEPKLRTLIWDFRSQPIPESLLADVEGFTAKLSEENEFVDQLRQLISPMEYRALQKRLAVLLEDRVYPEPGGRRSVPWPPM